jgi:DNA-binding GntR family transcriptional regulator
VVRADQDGELLGDSIFEQIKREIVECQLAPSDLIVESALAGRYGVSKGPVREALKRLSALGWVRALPRVGYVITPVRVTDVDEIFATRLLLEPEAVRLATARISEAELDELAKLAAAEATAHKESPMVRGTMIARANSHFHRAIARLSGNGRLERMVGSLVDELERVIHLLAQDVENLVDEHPIMVEVMRRGDPEAAATCMHEQLEAAHEAMRTAAMRSAQLGVIEQQTGAARRASAPR